MVEECESATCRLIESPRIFSGGEEFPQTMKARKPVSRLVNPSILRQLSRPLLRRLLEPYIEFLDAKDIALPPEVKKRKDYDFTVLAKALLDAEDRPAELLHALEAIGKMADIHGAEILSRSLMLGGEVAAAIRLKKAAAADVALSAYLDHMDVFQQALWEKQVVDTRRYKCFVPATGIDFSQARLTAATITYIERDIGQFFGDAIDGCQIITNDATPSTRWFIIEHGGRRHPLGIWRGKRNRERMEVELENDDVVRLNMVTGEMWIHAKVKSEFESYRSIFGRHLFGQENAFVAAGSIFNLEPLRTLGRRALEVDDIEDCPIDVIRLICVEVMVDVVNRLVQRISCRNDLYRVLDAGGGFIPPGEIVAARFEVRFKGSRKMTKVRVNLPSSADYERDSDGEWIGAWLKKRFGHRQPGN